MVDADSIFNELNIARLQSDSKQNGLDVSQTRGAVTGGRLLPKSLDLLGARSGSGLPELESVSPFSLTAEAL